MKTNSIKLLAGVTAGTFCLTVLTCFAGSTPQVEALKKKLSRVPALELPAKASQIVSSAKPAEKDSVAIAVVTAALDLKPTAAAAVVLVGAIARRAPEAAASAAATAAVRLPNQAEAILKSAVAAAPSQVGAIVFAVCKALPTKHNTLAMAAFEAAPDSGKAILDALGLAVPAARPFIEPATADTRKASSFPEIILQVENGILAGARAAHTTPEIFLTPAGSTPLSTPSSTPLLAGGPVFRASPPPTLGHNPRPPFPGTGQGNHYGRP